MTEYNLNDIENVVNTKFFTPFTIAEESQLIFSSVDDVRQYAKGNGELPPHAMMQRMLEAFFGHDSTCLINDKAGLAQMFAKLYKGWVLRLYNRNSLIAPNETDGYYDDIIHEKKIQFDQMYKQGNADIKRMIVAQLNEFKANHRTLSEIDVLLSKYCFVIASRYYVTKERKNKSHFKHYRRLREAVIEAWYDVITITTLKTVNPDHWFTSTDPRSIAMRLFPQDVIMDDYEVEHRFNKYKKWHKKAGAEALEEVKRTNPELVPATIREWDMALLLAKRLKDTMAIYREGDMTDFIVEEDEDEEEIEQQNRRLNEQQFKQYAEQQQASYDNRVGYSNDATDEEIQKYLRREDKKAARREKRSRNMFDRAMEED